MTRCAVLKVALFYSLVSIASAVWAATDQPLCTFEAPLVNTPRKFETPAVIYRERLSSTVEILELNWLEVLRERVKKAEQLGLFAEKRRQTSEVFRNLATNPKSLDLPRSLSQRIATVELTRYTLPKDKELPFVRALTNFERGFVFVDLGDPVQTLWLKDRLKSGKRDERIVAVGGSLTLAQELGVRLYYDQGRRLTSKFSVTSVPTEVKLVAHREPQTLIVKIQSRTFDMSAFEKELDTNNR